MVRIERARFVVSAEQAGKRIDQVLAANVEGLSRAAARNLLDLGGVFVNKKRTKRASTTVCAGDSIEANLGGAFERQQAQSKGRLTPAPSPHILYEDEDIIVVDKPAGLLTAPTPEGDRGTLQAALIQSHGRPIFVVHRLDMQTSGVLVMARTTDANRELSEHFRVHDITREYTAHVLGDFPADVLRIDEPVGGKVATTHVHVEHRFAGRATRLRCTLETGRTHQIRLHMQHAGHPVLGDAKYGAQFSPKPPRMALHAHLLGFVHPRTNQRMEFRAPLPPELVRWEGRLEGAS